MSTLETQYKNFKINNPDSTFTFEEWKQDFGKKLERSYNQLKIKMDMKDKITDEEIRNYLSNGGMLLNVSKMDSYRDGGTKVITCNYANPINFYIHMDNWTIHSEYPTTDENLVTDDFLKRYLIQGMKNYTQRLYENVTRMEDWVYNIEQ